MIPRSAAFKAEAKRALGDAGLRRALGNIQDNLVTGRRDALAALPEWEAMRDAGVAIKNHTLDHLGLYLELFAERVEAAGGHVHWAATGEAARDIVRDICLRSGARTVVKGKSMVSEEIGLNECLEASGITAVETDLGEYAIQLRGEAPSHIIAPAVHLDRFQIAEAFKTRHRDLPPERDIDQPAALLAEARAVLRRSFIEADIGITGANFLVAETGSAVIVTNEGNADLSLTLPRTHIVLAGIEKLVPNLDDALTLVRLLARSATGQAISTYTSVVTGPRRAGDRDGAQDFHVVLVDNGRSAMLGGKYRDMLRCIRCGACMNHCPVYGAVGGHAYGWVYPGPMGAVLTPHFIGLPEAGDLPNASTFCGKCADVCPVRIPLPALMRFLRDDQVTGGWGSRGARRALRAWGWLALRPRLYRRLAAWGLALARHWTGRRGRIGRLPFGRAWTASRDLPAPAAKSFTTLWREGRR